MPRASESTAAGSALTPILAGVVTAVVGFTSSFAVVLAGLHAVGADNAQAASGLFVLCLTMGAGCVAFSLIWRRPITMAWSTPGAAMLATAVTPAGGFAEAVGAFVITGVLLALTGLSKNLAKAVNRIPTAVANAMLAGVLLSLCLQPFRDLTRSPGAIGAVLVAWVVLTVLAPRWAVPGAVAAAAVAMVIDGSFSSADLSQVAPTLAWTTPEFSLATTLAIALPLYLVTMTSQNIPGVTVMSALGYEVPVRPALGYTGVATMAGAGFGGHAVNLSAIAATLAAGDEAGPDRSRRWIAGVVTGLVYMACGPASPTLVALGTAAPYGLFAAIAGVALLSSFASSAQQALAEPAHRLGAAVTFVVAASGLELAGIGSAFWALVIGCVFLGLDALASRRTAQVNR